MFVQLLITSLSLRQESRPVITDRSTGQPPPAASLQPPFGTSHLMDSEPAPTPAAPTAAASSAAFPTGTQSSALVPVASPAPAETSEELTLTLMSRHQVQLSISSPLQGDIRTQRGRNDALGYARVLAVVQPLSDTLLNLPHAVGELTAQLEIYREEAAAAKRLLVPVQRRVESLETLLNKSTAELNGLQAEIKRLKSVNVHIGSLLKNGKKSIDVQTENLRLAMNYAEQMQDIIDALDKQIEKEREVFKTTVFELPKSTFEHSALTKTRSSLFSDSNKRRATKKICSPLLKLWPRLPNKFRAVLPSIVVMEVTTAAPMIRLKRAADVGKRTPAAASSPTSSRRGLHMPDAWKSKRQDCLALAGFRSFTFQPGFSPFYISADCAFALSGPCQIARESPEVSSAFCVKPSGQIKVSRISNVRSCYSSQAVVDLTQDGSDEDIKEEPTAVPTELEDTEVTRQPSPTPSAALQRRNVASPPSLASSPPAGASPRARTSYELEMQLLFGSDDDEDAPSGSKVPREPAELTPYRSFSDEDTPSPPKRFDRAPISEHPSVSPPPPPRSPDSSDSDEGGASNGHDGDGAGGDDSRDDELSFDFHFGDTPMMKMSHH
ncbi:hypothetical protein L917_18804 [Phytophthora nicotianae]|uniref:Uncharacterized protein n=1 Tax=Phytophthora nicotianae TaxID=4792 RepID=W2K6D6_PHYNI|nr:hypothetical protein L917_18804 [Phytophthora nicotianae]